MYSARGFSHGEKKRTWKERERENNAFGCGWLSINMRFFVGASAVRLIIGFLALMRHAWPGHMYGAVAMFYEM